jgi:hypothetical protein
MCKHAAAASFFVSLYAAELMMRITLKVIHTVVVEWLALLLRIRKVPGSNLGLETGYPD